MNLTDKKLDIYEVEVGEEDFLYGISLVDCPAIQQNWITFKDDRKPALFAIEDGMKREIVSPLLINSQLIYRCDERGEYFVRWSQKAIEDIAVKLMETICYNNFTLSHEWFSTLSDKEYKETLVNGITTLELWITEDAQDKLYTEYGYSTAQVPVGSLAIHCKVENPDLWERIRSGEFKGFSIEGFVSYAKE